MKNIAIARRYFGTVPQLEKTREWMATLQSKA